MKANHNTDLVTWNIWRVVFQYVKDTIWKQITTRLSLTMQRTSLFFNTSKIQFESKSQHCCWVFLNLGSCFSIRQRYNLKANHNIFYLFCHLLNVVFQYVKDTIWKQITTIAHGIICFALLFFNTSKIQFESKSQHVNRLNTSLVSCFSIRQRYNLKANHNSKTGRTWTSLVVFQYVKDTIWKQITTIIYDDFKKSQLFFNTSKIQFESKSQLCKWTTCR